MTSGLVQYIGGRAAAHAFQMFISHLSGSEAEQQSLSSVHESEAQSDYQNSTSDSDGEDELDEFGFPFPPDTALPSGEVDNGAPLVLMENWDGQFILVQPRQERRRRRTAGSRGSRTNGTSGSVAGSTIAPSEQQDGEMNLVIDSEAVAAEFASSSSSDEWSGESDEDEGDTTDSMDEDDMPMLDSPAMQELIEQQIGGVDGEAQAAEAGMMMGIDIAGPPAIIVTDTTLPETPALSTTTTNTPNMAISASNPAANVPQTPASQPVMGTFLPTSTDPAQHAVIDGSKTTTKSPFTHRRRMRKNRADSMSSAGMGSTRSAIMSAGVPERKRKSHSSMGDPFSGPPIVPQPKKGISKKARYTSIPGHPKFVAAQLAAFDEHESTPSDEDDDVEAAALELEDMLEASLLHEAQNTAMGYEYGLDEEEHMRHLIRFDRVPMSTYIRRNFGNSGGRQLNGVNGEAGFAQQYRQPDHQHRHLNGAMSSPIRPPAAAPVAGLLTGYSADTATGGVSNTMMMIGDGNESVVAPGGDTGATLMGENQKMFISPFLAPVGDGKEGRTGARISSLQL